MKKMDLTVKEPLFFINEEPSGTNLSKSYAAFYQKKLYEIKAFNQALFTENKPINILYNKQFYGRVDLQNDSVILDQSKILSKITSTGDEIKLTNFVFDAYKDFVSYWDYLKKIDKLNKNSIFYNLKAVVSWIDPGKIYFYYMSQVFDQLKNQIKTKNINIKNFNDFADQFIEYVDATSPFVPLTFSSFIRSRMATPLISGLCFDVNSLDLTDDGVKYSQALKDPNYAIFKKTAMKYGFFPDKHIPWRLYADIDSPAMIPYMEKYKLTQDNLYNTNYVSANLYDLELLRFYLVQFYNTYIIGKPELREVNFDICKKTGDTKITYKIHKLEQLNLESIKSDLVYDNLFIKLYIFTKGRENNFNWDQSRFENIMYKFIQIKEALDIPNAMKYVTPLFRSPVVSQQRNRNFKL